MLSTPIGFAIIVPRSVQLQKAKSHNDNVELAIGDLGYAGEDSAHSAVS